MVLAASRGSSTIRQTRIMFGPPFPTSNSASSGNGFGHVFKSADGGATWTLADGNQIAGNVNAIPDIPAHSVVVDPNNNQRIYVGTDLGVFVSLDAERIGCRKRPVFLTRLSSLCRS